MDKTDQLVTKSEGEVSPSPKSHPRDLGKDNYEVWRERTHKRAFRPAPDQEGSSIATHPELVDQDLKTSGEVILELAKLEKIYGPTDRQLPVLRGANLSIGSGQIYGLIGPSGAGKSTLLQIAGLLDLPTSGTVTIAGAAAEDLGDWDRTLLRRDTIGFVYQFHHLLKEFNALENVMMPQRVAGVAHRPAKARAEELLVRVGLQDRLTHRPAALSGGEQQRVAIARALANRPALLLADEPTGNLDPDTAEIVFQMLLSLTREEGMAALIATHNLDLGQRMDRRVRLDGGLLVEA